MRLNFVHDFEKRYNQRFIRIFANISGILYFFLRRKRRDPADQEGQSAQDKERNDPNEGRGAAQIHEKQLEHVGCEESGACEP